MAMIINAETRGLTQQKLWCKIKVIWRKF